MIIINIYIGINSIISINKTNTDKAGETIHCWGSAEKRDIHRTKLQEFHRFAGQASPHFL